jgi:hypothetical protein
LLSVFQGASFASNAWIEPDFDNYQAQQDLGDGKEVSIGTINSLTANPAPAELVGLGCGYNQAPDRRHGCIKRYAFWPRALVQDDGRLGPLINCRSLCFKQLHLGDMFLAGLSLPLARLECALPITYKVRLIYSLIHVVYPLCRPGYLLH